MHNFYYISTSLLVNINLLLCLICKLNFFLCTYRKKHNICIWSNTILGFRQHWGVLGYIPHELEGITTISFLCLKCSTGFLLKIKFKLLTMACRALLTFLNSPPIVPLDHSVPATQTSWLFFRQIKPLHTSGPSHLLVPLPKLLFPRLSHS